VEQSFVYVEVDIREGGGKESSGRTNIFGRIMYSRQCEKWKRRKEVLSSQ
jgi:hypothetical protein